MSKDTNLERTRELGPSTLASRPRLPPFQFLKLCLLQMSTIYEPCYLLHERAAFLPEVRLTANGGALSPIQPLYYDNAHSGYYVRSLHRCYKYCTLFSCFFISTDKSLSTKLICILFRKVLKYFASSAENIVRFACEKLAHPFSEIST